MAENPTITLGDKTYSIPLMTIKQNRELEFLVMRNLELFFAVSQGNQLDIIKALSQIGKQQLDDFYEIVYIGLTKADPGMTREIFENIEAGMKEIVQAANVVISRSGLFRKETVPSGEAQAT